MSFKDISDQRVLKVMNALNEIFSIKVVGNSVEDWAFAVVAFAVTFTVLPLLKKYLSRLVKRSASDNERHSAWLALRLIPRTSRIFILVVAINAGMHFLNFSRRIDEVLHVLILTGFWFQIGLWAMTAIEFLLERKQVQRSGDPNFVSSLGVLNFIARLVIWTVVILLALDNLGVNITTLVAGLGVGGIAIALAVQTILGDLLASLSITLDRPFKVGDQLVVDDISGKVENIGIRSTRLRSVNGEQIVMSNADLLKSRLHNFGHMEERRGVLNIHVAYETSVEKLKRVPKIIVEAVASQKGVRLDRCHFKEVGTSSLNFEAIYFVLDPQFENLMDAQQVINYYIVEAFANESIAFAYPTQTVYVRGNT
jgi:small-conductance mechanosensitive channel